MQTLRQCSEWSLIQLNCDAPCQRSNYSFLACGIIQFTRQDRASQNYTFAALVVKFYISCLCKREHHKDFISRTQNEVGPHLKYFHPWCYRISCECVRKEILTCFKAASYRLLRYLSYYFWWSIPAIWYRGSLDGDSETLRNEGSTVWRRTFLSCIVSVST